MSFCGANFESRSAAAPAFRFESDSQPAAAAAAQLHSGTLLPLTLTGNNHHPISRNTSTILRSTAFDSAPDGPSHQRTSAPIQDQPHLTTAARSLSAYETHSSRKSMEDLLAREQAAEHNVLTLLKRTDVPIEHVLHAFHIYRQAASEYIFANFEHAERSEAHLWQAHNAGKKYFHKELSRFRKQSEKVVETRHVTKLFMQFIKQGEQYYREFTRHLNTACGGIPELEAIAWVEKADSPGESQPAAHLQISKDSARESVHRALIYAGDLCRYRASEQLDKVPSFAPALGYYGLAASIVPSSGLGHHQQAVVALEQRNHLRAIYHLYRSICVPNPHPLAMNNLNKEFEKTNAAWEKGELIQKGPPNDPDAPKHVLVGWFVRLHSMCFKGERFTGYQELEREIISQLINLITHPSLHGTIERMILVNIAAQETAGVHFQELAAQNLPTGETEKSFLHYFRFNVETFSALLQVFYSDRRNLLMNMADQEGELADKLTPTSRRLLPCLCIYNNWLMANVHMVTGLTADDVAGKSVAAFWPVYARAIDLVAQAFPIWDLEEHLEQVSCATYMMEEDVETFRFTPVTRDETLSTWLEKAKPQVPKPSFARKNVVRSSPDDEMLYRMYKFLATGTNIATTNSNAPIGMTGTRVYCGAPENLDALTVRPIEYQPAPIAPPSKAIQQQSVPVSYAAAAANGHAKQRRPAPAPRKTSATKQTRDAQLVRMVEDLVEETDLKDPVTPPQPPASTPAIVTNGDASFGLQDSVQDLGQALPKYAKPSRAAAAKSWRPPPGVAVTPPAVRPVNMARPLSGNHERLQSVSKLWNEGPNMTGTLGSPIPSTAPGHSRVNSASSIRSRNSLNQVDTWGSTESAPRTLPESVVPQTVYDGDYSSIDQAGMASPLLFGAGGSVWSSMPNTNGARNVSPSYGQGG